MFQMMHASEMAPAKVNLSLHLVARRADGYHLLDSIVAFLDMGDTLHATVTTDNALSLTIEGAYAAGLAAEDNLVIRAARLLQERAAIDAGARLRLVKETPVGAGLGGGSADAAAALRLLNRLWRCGYNLMQLAELGEALGADVPACVFSGAVRMEGIGEKLTALPYLPEFPLVVMHPAIPLWTPEVYKAAAGKEFSGMFAAIPRAGATQGEWLEWLAATRNDLQPAADRLIADIGRMCEVLQRQEGCVLSRMSGSGSACFGIFASAAAARLAQQALQEAQPQWWVRACHTQQAMQLA